MFRDALGDIILSEALRATDIEERGVPATLTGEATGDAIFAVAGMTTTW